MFLSPCTKEQLCTLTSTISDQQTRELVTWWTDPKELALLTAYKTDCVDKAQEDQNLMKFYDSKMSSTTITKLEKK